MRHTYLLAAGALALASLAAGCKSDAPEAQPAPIRKPHQPPRPDVVTSSPDTVAAPSPDTVAEPDPDTATPAPDTAPDPVTADAAATATLCAEIARAHDKQLAGFGESFPAADGLLRRLRSDFGRCIPTRGGGAWVLTLEVGVGTDPMHVGQQAWSPLTAENAPADVMGTVNRWKINYIDAGRVVSSAPAVVTGPDWDTFACGGETWCVQIAHASAYDFDGDGVAELVLRGAQRQNESPDRTFSSIATFADGRIVRYGHTPKFQFDRVADVDGDGRPDLVTHHPYRAEGRDGMSDYPVVVEGPELVAHARPDGTFSTSDAAARAFARESCWLPPREEILTVYSPDNPRRVACALLWGVPEATLTKALDGCSERGLNTPEMGPHPEPSCPEGGGGLRQWLASTPPLSLTASGVLTPTVTASSVTASSTQPDWKTYTFGPDNLVDGALDTSWQPGHTGNGAGAWVRFRFDRAVTLRAVEIAAGLQRRDDLGDLFLMNRRPTLVALLFDDGLGEPFWLHPTRRGFQQRQLTAPRTTKSLTLVVLESAPGTRWDQLAISELRLHGTPAEAATSPVAPAPAGDVTCGSSAWIPWRDRVVEHCGGNHGSACAAALAVFGWCHERPPALTVAADAALVRHVVTMGEEEPEYVKDETYKAFKYVFPVGEVPADQRYLLTTRFERTEAGWSVKRVHGVAGPR